MTVRSPLGEETFHWLPPWAKGTVSGVVARVRSHQSQNGSLMWFTSFMLSSSNRAIRQSPGVPSAVERSCQPGFDDMPKHQFADNDTHSDDPSEE